MSYWQKIRGATRGGPPRVSNEEVFWSWVGAFLGIAALAVVGSLFFAGTDRLLTVASLGASAVLVFGANRSPLAQPRNVLGGHVISALVGVAAFKLLRGQPWLAEAVAVATSIALMHLTRTLHPPGGATALIAVGGGDAIHDLGFSYVLAPVGIGAAILVLVGVLVNNIPASRRYPEFWF
jgi:CBS-domain-containing membrane protein